ncbi:MAG: type II toxin-antitoxin system RelE/ParE family toxin [Chloroflexota bacterium]|nr:type II toxin-antitoxin system RelE/ParE family toxin [Chloroflexota bacterium]MDE2684469.1 type II toxin-antitoxin system RelE/ParE family toxin [Chloroflexota bacterium]
MDWLVQFTQSALGTLREISDRRIRRLILSRAEELGREPHALSTPLQGELSGYRSIRAVGQRYRIVFQIDEGRRQVTIIAVGIRREGHRRDIYALAQRLIRLGLVEPPQD